MIIESKVTLGLIFAMAVQAVAALVWAGSAAERLSGVEERVAAAQPVAERLARLETEIVAVRRQLDRIERRLGDE